MEVGGGGLDAVPEAPVVELKPHLSEAAETERKSAMIRAGKTPEERQAEFKEMLLERGVRKWPSSSVTFLCTRWLALPILLPFPLPLLHNYVSLPLCFALSLPPSASRYQPSPRGRKSCRSLSLTLATCCLVPRRGRAALRSSFAHEQRRRGGRREAS